LTNASTAVDSVGMLGTYWKLGKRKADAGGASEESWSRATAGSLPGSETGIEREADGGWDGRAFWCVGDSVGGKEELVSMMLWYGCGGPSC